MSSRPADGPSPARASPARRELVAQPKDQQLTVALRIRPLNDAELEEGATVIAHKVGEQMVVLMDPGDDAEDTLRTHRSREKTFIFDTVFDPGASQEDVYRATTQHLVEGVISGYNATVFAYGPSGAGKTHSMLGMAAEPGIYVQTLTDLFQAIEGTRDSMDYRVSMSYLEIYNEVIRDLLNPSSGFLDLREDSRGSIQIAGITEASTSNAQEIMQLLTKGNRQRTQEPTATNRTSSRSHAVLQVTVRQWARGAHLAEEVCIGRLFMVDLAGSERASQTQNRGKRMKEGAHINRSLLALGNCINALSERGASRAQYVNFRDSKLTRLLKDALGGNSRTVMIAHISPASSAFEESRSTLLYAYRAKNIKTRVKRNLLNVSYHIAQYTDVISDLRREIEHLKSKIERQEKEKCQPGVRDAQVTVLPHDAEEDSRLQMNKIRAQLIGAFKEQMEIQRSLMELENTNIELHIDTSRHLLTIADWEREQPHQQAPREPGEAGKEVDTEGEEPHEVALAREELSMLLAEQRRTATLKAGLERRLAGAKEKASHLEQLLPRQVASEEQREVLRLLCRAHELELGSTELRADNLYRRNLLCQKDLVIQRCHQHRLLCEQIIQEQRQLICDAGIAVPETLDARYRLYSRELGEGALSRLLLLPSRRPGSSERDGCALGPSPPPEGAGRDPRDSRKDLPWGAQLELPPRLLETDRDGCRSLKATPSRAPGKLDSLLPPPSFRTLLTPPTHERSGPLSVRTLASRLCSPGGPERGACGALSPQALREMARSTESIARIAASRRSRAHDCGPGSGRSSRQRPEDAAPDARDPKPGGTPDPGPPARRPRASPSAERAAERSRREPAAALPRGAQAVAEKLQVPSVEHLAESQLPPALILQPSKSGKSLFPAVPTASKIKPSLSLHAGSTDSGGHRHSPLPPSMTRRPWGGSAQRPRRPR